MQCTERPERIEVHQRANGLAECFIRRNIHEIADAEGNVAFECDEVQFVGTFTRAYVEQHEDELWRKYDNTPINERIAAAEKAQVDTDDAIIALFEQLIGE